jgi:4-hydroxybenzoate polyprenyltransferase
MKNYINLLRVHQWLKNLMLLFPPFLGGTLMHMLSLFQFLVPLVSFSFAASALYIVNDLFDLSLDRSHPEKCRRPLSAGTIKVSVAVILAVALFFCALLTGVFVSKKFIIILLVYIVISFCYSAYLKNVPILELFCIVSGFLLRLQAGGDAYNTSITNWLFLSVFLLALFLVCGKRLAETLNLGAVPPSQTRPVLSYYPSGFLEGGLYMSGAAALVTYTLYVISHEGNILLIPLCCFGLLSYVLRIFSGKGGDPTRALLKDPALLIVGILWVVMVGIDTF